MYSHNIFQRAISIDGWDITTSGFGKQTAAILEFYFRFRFWCSRRQRYFVLHEQTKFCTNRSIRAGLMTSWRFSWWRLRRRKSTSSFGFGNDTRLRTLKSTRKPNFSELSQSAAEILLLPVLENKRPPYWNSVSGFHSDVFVVRGMSFCISGPNFVQIGPLLMELLLLPVSENRWPPYLNSISDFGFDAFIVIGVSFCISVANFVQIGQSAAQLWRHYDFQDGSRGVTNLLPVSDLAMSVI